MISVITTTKDRPLGVSLLERWLQRQEVDFQWIIATDQADTSTLPDWATVVYRRGLSYLCNGKTVSRTVKHHSMLNNLYAGLKVAQDSDMILIMEDDEYYDVDYIRHTAGELTRYDLYGWTPSHYFHLPKGYYKNTHNQSYASLACTGWTRIVTPLVFDLIGRGDVFIDRILWDKFDGARAFGNNKEAPINVSFKGLPGSAGIGKSHRTGLGGPDYGNERLKSYIGKEDLELVLRETGIVQRQSGLLTRMRG